MRVRRRGRLTLGTHEDAGNEVVPRSLDAMRASRSGSKARQRYCRSNQGSVFCFPQVRRRRRFSVGTRQDPSNLAGGMDDDLLGPWRSPTRFSQFVLDMRVISYAACRGGATLDWPRAFDGDAVSFLAHEQRGQSPRHTDRFCELFLACTRTLGAMVRRGVHAALMASLADSWPARSYASATPQRWRPGPDDTGARHPLGRAALPCRIIAAGRAALGVAPGAPGCARKMEGDCSCGDPHMARARARACGVGG